MKTDLKRQFCMRWEELVLILGMESIFFLFGEILLGIVVYGLGEKESIVPAGTILAVTIPVFLMVVMGIGSLPLCFNLSVAMGATRKRTLPASFIVSLFQNGLAVFLLYVFFWLERWIMRVAYAGIRVELDMRYLFQWKYMVPACFALSAFHALMGALVLKYGTKVFTIFWVLWMAVFIGGPRIGRMMEQGRNFPFLQVCRKAVSIVSHLSETGILLIVTGGSILLVWVSWMLLRRQQVDFI